MVKRARVRFWIPIVASASFFPLAALAMLGGWLLHMYSTPSTSAVSRVDKAVQPVSGAVAHPAAPAPDATPKPPLTTPILGNAQPAFSNSAQDASPEKSPAMSGGSVASETPVPIPNPVPEVQAEGPAPQPAAEAVAPPLNAGSATPPVFASLAIAPLTHHPPPAAASIPLPRPRPKIANVSRMAPAPKPRPVESSTRQTPPR